jgi:hypothetical protein
VEAVVAKQAEAVAAAVNEPGKSQIYALLINDETEVMEGHDQSKPNASVPTGTWHVIFFNFKQDGMVVRGPFVVTMPSKQGVREVVGFMDLQNLLALSSTLYKQRDSLDTVPLNADRGNCKMMSGWFQG